jgi:hypothetical protein
MTGSISDLELKIKSLKNIKFWEEHNEIIH